MSFSNTILTDEENRWINECCGRLRRIQADAASALPEKRIEYLEEEVSHSLKNIPAADHKRYLEALVARFPVAGRLPQVQIAAAGIPAPEGVVEQFFLQAKKLSGQERQQLTERLRQEGFVPAAPGAEGGAGSLNITEETRQKLGLSAGQPFDAARAVALAALLVEEICLLDKMALKTMRELSSRSALLKRLENFRSPAAHFLTNQTESVEPQLHEIRALLASLLAAMQGGGKEFGRDFMAHLSPSAIEDIIVGEGGSRFLGPNKKERCWDRYRDLAGDYGSLDQVDRKIKDCMAAFIERLQMDKR